MNTEAHTFIEENLRFIAKVTTSRSDVALPIALAEDMILVEVEGSEFTKPSIYRSTNGTNETKEPERSLDVKHPRIAEFLLKEIALSSLRTR